jgi:transcriptional regulator with XRE-family HTH domain
MVPRHSPNVSVPSLLYRSHGSMTVGGGTVEIADVTDLGRILRAARARNGWSQQEAADAAGVSRRLVNLLEGGRHPNAEVWRVLALLNALEVPLHADLLDEVSSDPPLGPIANQDDIDLDAYLATFRTGVSRT